MKRSLVHRVVRRLGRELGLGPGKPPASHPAWTKVEKGPLAGAELFLDLGAAPWQKEMVVGAFEPHLFQAIEDAANLAGAVVWDIGGHIGYHSLMLAAMAGPSGRVFAFEPSPYNLVRFRLHLEKNLALACRITLNGFALDSEEGEAILMAQPEVDDGSSSGSTLESAIKPEHRVHFQALNKVSVRCRQGDRIVDEGLAAPPDLVKIDVEGAEAKVLKGMEAVLRRKLPVIAVEIHNVTAMFEVLSLLVPLGYKGQILAPELATESRCHLMLACPKAGSA